MAGLLSIAALVTAVQALALEGKNPEPTLSSKPDPTFQFPKITLPPSIRELSKRQNGQTVLIGSDNTCGFFDGRPGAAYTCNGKSLTCALVTTSTIGAVGCCDQDDCGLRVACIDYREFAYSSACDNGCVQDTFTVKCTRSSAPFCATVTFFSGIVDYYCDTLSDSTPQQLYTTWHGESDGRSFTPVVVTSDESITAPLTSATQTGGDNEDDSRTSSSGSAGATAPVNDGGDSSDSSNSSSNSSNSSTNVGAIAGGVVGGVAGLALIGLGIFFLIRHINKKNRNITAQPPTAQMQQGAVPGVPPTQPGAGAAGYQQQPYNPHYSQQYSPPLPGYPQQAYYADQNKPGGFAAVAPMGQFPDRNDSTSPTNSQFTDNRQSVQQQSTSPTSTVNSNWQQNQPYPGQQPSPIPNVPPTVHEAGGNVVGERNYNDNHHGELHELGN
ncbi:uncharacterized protein F4812DRAFT_177210 [Daldinia caldariorum]|uniref:uncharacterized protein n=1 Tax=Daldinia caldariorum TaxID=326644 RepID=UPI002008E7B0|nr:uncharacterized protein F4812DRAFT_177210 [Daldinia caldariorum]KAI1471394.1 hypothetical protein F4812DRAFT_177210 [Daldinia caldariorum]